MNKTIFRIKLWCNSIIGKKLLDVLLSKDFETRVYRMSRVKFYQDFFKGTPYWEKLLAAAQKLVADINDFEGLSGHGNLYEYVETFHKPLNMSRKTLTRLIVLSYGIVAFYEEYGNIYSTSNGES